MPDSMMQHLHRIVLHQHEARGDGELLGCFLDHGEESALTVLIERHASMVWGVCRRLLAPQDAEDAFQATFLVLVRKARSIVPREKVSNWLYGVAHQTALQARRTAYRRRLREVQREHLPDVPTSPQNNRDEQVLLHQELSRLPAIYRTVLVLCELEGRTRKEVAQQLCVPEGTVGGRLARAKAMLGKRLAQRGIVLTGTMLAVENVPARLTASTVRLATGAVSQQLGTVGLISISVAALTEGVLNAMLINKLKMVLAAVLLLGAVTCGGRIFVNRMVAASSQPPASEPPGAGPATPAPPAKRDFTAWGKQRGGLQAGLGYPDGQKRTYRPGETITLHVRVRNVSKEPVRFQYLWAFLAETPPSLADPKGKPVDLPRLSAEGLQAPRRLTLAEGEEITIYKLTLKIGREEGKYQVQYERILGDSSGGTLEVDPVLAKLGTGTLDLDVADRKEPSSAEDEGRIPDSTRVAPDALLPADVENKRPDEVVTVAFSVEGVGLLTGAVRVGEPPYLPITLYSSAGLKDRRSRFSVTFVGKALTHIHHLGIGEPTKYFQGRTIEVKGKVNYGSYPRVTLPDGRVQVLADNYPRYDIIVNDLDNFRITR